MMCSQQVQDAAKLKVKKKKAKKSGVGVAGDTTRHWNELFTLPERGGLVGEAAATSEER